MLRRSASETIGAGRGTVGEPLGDPDDLLFQLGLEIEIRLAVVDQVVEQANRRGGRPPMPTSSCTCS